MIISINCILKFQTGLTASEVLFKVEKEEDGPEPLRMEHFYFPLGLWLTGLLLSAFFLLAEIIIHRRRKSQTQVAQSTPESEYLGEMVLNKGRAVRLPATEGAEVSGNIEDTKV